MLIGLTGYAGSGKDTAAAYLSKYGLTRIAFADKLRELAYAINPWFDTFDLQYAVDSVGWDMAKSNPQVRAYLQECGMAHREVFGADFWVDRALPGLKGAALRGWRARNRIVVTDVRFPNEAARIRSLGGVVVRVERTTVGPVNGHVSEHRLPDVDYTVLNDCPLSELYERLDLLMEELEA